MTMTIERLLELAITTPAISYERRRFAFRDGLRILFDLIEEDDDWSCGKDEFWYGNIYEVAPKITEEQAIRLFGLGWGICKDRFCISQYS